MTQNPDEETPLLRDQSLRDGQQVDKPKKRTPLPWRQFFILLLLQLSEPISSQVIAPFLPQLIQNFGITGGKDSLVAFYVGLLTSLFFLTEACTIFHWSRLSDHIGRKPVLLIGLFGLSASMWCFGVSKTFWGLVISRCLNGALNGNVGVMKSMVVEITDPTNIAQAYGILPVTWSIGMTVGPLIGGSLASPAERFPSMFGNSSFLKEYPYFLPCAVSATITATSWLITLIFLKETRKTRVTLRQYFFGGTTKPTLDSQIHGIAHDVPAQGTTDQPLPFRSLLVRPVIIAAGSYATFALIEISVRVVLPVFCAMPIEMGGLNLDPPTIGTIMGFLGISAGILQSVFFARIHDWLGAKRMFLVAVSLCFPLIALFPLINAVARVYGFGYLVWSLLALQMTLFIFSGFTYGITFMYISASAPNQASIGATNGLAQVVVSMMRAVGPMMVNSTFSLSIEKNIMGGYLAYFVMMAMVCLALWVGSLLPRKMWNN